MEVSNFNLRVYGLLFHNQSVLVTHEHRAGMVMTKFPGGGLEKGEGLADGLMREFLEELSLPVYVRDIFYVNDFLQISAFNPADQLISFYYEVHSEPNAIAQIIHSDITQLKPGKQVFQWVKTHELNPDQFTFPVDRVVAGKLKELKRAQ